jgi:hypothetical protein
MSMEDVSSVFGKMKVSMKKGAKFTEIGAKKLKIQAEIKLCESIIKSSKQEFGVAGAWDGGGGEVNECP